MKNLTGKRKFRFNKLVRDGVLEEWTQENVIAKVVFLDNKEFTQALLHKLQEETQEVVECTQKEHLKKELGDVLEIVHQIAKNAGISIEEIEETRKEKLAKYGVWEKRLFVEWATFPVEHPTVDYCSNNADRFPEIVDE